MSKNAVTKKSGFSVSASVLTQRDADAFKKAAKKYAASATASKKKARETLVSLGIYTTSGRISKRYK